jgi:thioredoxin 1
MSEHVHEFTDQSFQSDVLHSQSPVLVDFWAPWCGPCRQIAPLIEQLGVQYAGRVKIGKVNIDDNPQAAQHYGIQSIPTLLLFKGGEVVDRFVGMPARTKLEDRLEASIS